MQSLLESAAELLGGGKSRSASRRASPSAQNRENPLQNEPPRMALQRAFGGRSATSARSSPSVLPPLPGRHHPAASASAHRASPAVAYPQLHHSQYGNPLFGSSQNQNYVNSSTKSVPLSRTDTSNDGSLVSSSYGHFNKSQSNHSAMMMNNLQGMPNANTTATGKFSRTYPASASHTRHPPSTSEFLVSPQPPRMPHYPGMSAPSSIHPDTKSVAISAIPPFPGPPAAVASPPTGWQQQPPVQLQDSSLNRNLATMSVPLFHPPSSSTGATAVDLPVSALPSSLQPSPVRSLVPSVSTAAPTTTFINAVQQQPRQPGFAAPPSAVPASTAQLQHPAGRQMTGGMQSIAGGMQSIAGGMQSTTGGMQRPGAVVLGMPARDIGKLTVFYFGELKAFAGRGGPIRLLLLGERVKHDYVEVPFAESWATLKEELMSGDSEAVSRSLGWPPNSLTAIMNPQGTLPILIHADKLMSETTAIMRYIAKKIGLYGMNHTVDFFADMIMDKLEYWRDELMACIQTDTSIFLFRQRRQQLLNVIDIENDHDHEEQDQREAELVEKHIAVMHDYAQTRVSQYGLFENVIGLATKLEEQTDVFTNFKMTTALGATWHVCT